MKILLGNDTGTVEHAGCRAVSDGHARLLGRAGHEVTQRLFRNGLTRHQSVAGDDGGVVASLERDDAVMAMVEAVDAVVVNGEGTLHHGAGRPWLALLKLAQRRGKATLLVNAVFQEMTGYEATLGRLDDFTVREGRSLAEARKRGGRPRIVPDSYFAARFLPSAERFSGDVVTDWHQQRVDTAAILERYLADRASTFCPLLSPAAAATWQTLPGRLTGADCLLTGRHHGICAAIVAGVPFVAAGSNTHKIEGLLEDLGLGFLAVGSFEDLLRMRDWAVDHRERFTTLLDRLTGGRPLSTFERLGTTGEDRENQEVAQLAEQVRAADRAA